jgi:hypothetical protein
MSQDLRESFLGELRDVHNRLSRLEKMAGFMEMVRGGVKSVSDAVNGGPFDAEHIATWIHKKYKVEYNKNGSNITFNHNGHAFVINSNDGKNFTITKDSDPSKPFSNYKELEIHMKSLVLNSQAASVRDVVRYSRALMQCQGARCGQLLYV